MTAAMDQPHRRSNACALVCCGVLLSDRTRFLLQDERPNWTHRRRLNYYLPLGLWISMILLEYGALPSECRNGQENDAETCQPDPNLVVWANTLQWVLLVVIAVLLWRGSRHRAELRTLLWTKLQQQNNNKLEPHQINFTMKMRLQQWLHRPMQYNRKSTMLWDVVAVMLEMTTKIWNCQ